MPNGRLGSNQQSSQVFNAAGESTPEAKLPESYVSAPVASSPIAAQLQAPSDFTGLYPGMPNALVMRAPRMTGMRYLYARGMVRMPVKRLGADGIPVPWNSAFQPNDHGPVHDAGFNDKLFQAGIVSGLGWPGRQVLNLSFKVPTVNRGNGPGYNMHMTGPLASQPQSTTVTTVSRAPSSSVQTG